MTLNKFGNIAKHAALSVGLVLAATSFAHAGTVNKKSSEPAVDQITQVVKADSLKEQTDQLFAKKTTSFNVKEPVQQMMVAAIDFMGKPNAQLSKLGQYLSTVDVGQFSNSATFLVRDLVINLENNNPGAFTNISKNAKKDNSVVQLSQSLTEKVFGDLTQQPEYKTLTVNYLNSIKAEISSTTKNTNQITQVDAELNKIQPSIQTTVQNGATQVKDGLTSGIASITAKIKSMQQSSEQSSPTIKAQVQENVNAGTEKVSEAANTVKNFTLGGLSDIASKIKSMQEETASKRAEMGLSNEARPAYGPNVK
jgi:hypothetical protein